ncbi:MAG: hypothetical protein SGILL_007738 [Bacillariaceae sp.]
MTTSSHSNPCCSPYHLVLFTIAICATWLTLWSRDRHAPHRQSQPTFTDITWEFAGPTTYVSAFGNDDDDDPDDPPKLASAAAVQNVVQAANHTWFIGSVNGGIWRTRNIRADKVHWENVLDHQPTIRCTSMSALHVSQSNASTIYAGCGGSTSGEQGPDWNVVNSADWGGIMVSYDLGDTWAMMDGFPVNYYVTDILEVDDKSLLVSAQSHLWDRSDGGIWLSNDGGNTFDKVESSSTFTLTPVQLPCDNSDLASNTAILATHAHSVDRTASISTDGGKTFNDLSLPWREGSIPFYTCATQLAGGQIVVGGLTRLAGGLPNNTASQIFLLPTFGVEKITLDDLAWLELDQPMRMDQDSMPKDRMALLADPKHDDMMYVAGNAEALAWRVNTTTGEWSKLWDEDVVDGSIPHGDCRNYAWDSGDCKDSDARLVLVSDGGVFARLQPRNPGGRWISLNGDYAGLELLSAKYDAKGDRYVMGAQDNCAIVTKPGAIPGDVGLGFVEGDGTVTMVDSDASPSRLFGTTQFLGVGTIDDDPKTDGVESSDEDDDGCGGFCFVQGDEYIQIKLDDYFTKPSNFPYFVHPYTLNRNDPTRLLIWVNGTMENEDSTCGECGFYEFYLPYSVKDADDIAPPTKVLGSPPGEMILDFVSGGTTKGNDNPDLIVGISTSHLYVRSGVVGTHESTEKPEMEVKSRKSSAKYATSTAGLVKRPLPITFAAPVGLQYDDSNDGARILGPLTHARTVFMEVSESDSQVIAITGWTEIDSNFGEESIFVTMDGGQNWRNVTGNLHDASGVCGKVRPGGLLLMDLPSDSSSEGSDEGRALLVGTSNGILATFLGTEDGTYGSSTTTSWRRLGGEEFPIVLVTDITYDSLSDRLVAATYGRGIYVMKKAQNMLQQFFLQR